MRCAQPAFGKWRGRAFTTPDVQERFAAWLTKLNRSSAWVDNIERNEEVRVGSRRGHPQLRRHWPGDLRLCSEGVGHERDAVTEASIRGAGVEPGLELQTAGCCIN